MKTLFIDIETSPNIVYTWGLFNQNIGVNQIITPTGVLCFAAQFDDSKMMFHSKWNDGHEGMIRAAWELLDQANVVVHYNGKSFDVPHLNREFLQLGLTPPSPFVQVDLLLVARKQFNFTSNKLEFVSRALDLEGKIEHEGFGLWEKVLAGEIRAQNRMMKYNKRDVTLLLELYEQFLPWIPSHPSRTLYDDTGCPRCGAIDSLQRRGFAYTKVSKYQQWHCLACGTYFRAAKREEGVSIQESVL